MIICYKNIYNSYINGSSVKEVFMKRVGTIIISFCLILGMFVKSDFKVYAEVKQEDYRVEFNQKEQLKNINYVFSKDELKNTPYEGHDVEIIEGELYVDKSIILTVKIWILTTGYPILAAYLTKSGSLSLTGKYPPGVTSSLVNTILNAWNRYGDMADAYATQAQKLVSFKLSNGNECVPTSATTYACKWSA
mgnify:CR=1 FL=1